MRKWSIYNQPERPGRVPRLWSQLGRLRQLLLGCQPSSSLVRWHKAILHFLSPGPRFSLWRRQWRKEDFPRQWFHEGKKGWKKQKIPSIPGKKLGSEAGLPHFSALWPYPLGTHQLSLTLSSVGWSLSLHGPLFPHKCKIVMITLSHMGIKCLQKSRFLLLWFPSIYDLLLCWIVFWNLIVYLWYLEIMTLLGFSATVTYLSFCAQQLVQCWPLEVAQWMPAEIVDESMNQQMKKWMNAWKPEGLYTSVTEG